MTASKQTLTTHAIRQWVGDESFRRGERYYRDGMIIHARRTGTALKAESHGSGGNLYRVQATVADDQIVSADCSCPVGDGGHCKHVAALLLTWLNQPDDFQEVEDTNTALERRSKEELMALVKQMLLRAPELESLLEVPLPTGKKSRQKVNPETYRRQVTAAFGGSDFEYGSAESIADDLSATVKIADDFFAQGDIENAATIYQVTANGVVENYEDVDDESGALSAVVQDCVEGLGECLEDDGVRTDTALCEKLLRALFEVYRFDVDFGGVGLSDGVPDLILQHADAAEKKRVAEWTRAAMKKRTGNEWSDNWHREAYGGFLLRLEADELDDEAYLRLCRETHRLNNLVERLLKLKRVEDARAEAASAGDYELLALADIFVQHKQAQVAERLMTERAQTTQDTRIFDWLKERSRKHGDLAAALTWARKTNAVRPSLEQYREIRKLAKTAGTWESVRTELLADLAEQKDFGLLTLIHLDEKEIDAALETAEKTQGSYAYFSPDLRLQVAKAAEETRPRQALRIYLQAAERIVKARNRGAYSEACKYLVRVRTLYQKLGEDAAWEQYLRKLEEETKAMRAFKEEMTKAKL